MYLSGQDYRVVHLVIPVYTYMYICMYACAPPPPCRPDTRLEILVNLVEEEEIRFHASVTKGVVGERIRTKEVMRSSLYSLLSRSKSDGYGYSTCIYESFRARSELRIT